MNRKEAREFMMKVFFQMDACKDFDVDSRDNYFRDTDFGVQAEYCKNMYSLMCNKKEEIDAAIDENSEKWNVKRMPKTAVAILRTAACEMLFIDNIPDPVSINEAVEMAKVYGDDNSPAYINAILGRLEKSKAAK